MDFPLRPQTGLTDPDTLLEQFLDYVQAKGLELYPAQEEAILELYAGKNLILNTPTGSGKSLVAAALHFLSVSMGKQAVYNCAIKVLMNWIPISMLTGSVLYSFCVAVFSIHDGDRKLVLGNGSGGRQAAKGKRFERPWTLFNLKEDLGETQNRYDQHPDKATQLELEALPLITNNRSR